MTHFYANGAARKSPPAADDPGYGLRRCRQCGKALLRVDYLIGRVAVDCSRCKATNVFESVDGYTPARGCPAPAEQRLAQRVAALVARGPRLMAPQEVFDIMEARWEEFVRRARRQRAELAAGLRFQVFVRDEFRCRYCGRAAEDAIILHVDHVIPRSKGGSDSVDNLVTACAECNLGKGASLLGV